MADLPPLPVENPTSDLSLSFPAHDVSPSPDVSAVQNPTSDTPVSLSLSSPAHDVSPSPDVSAVQNPTSDTPVSLSLSSPAPDVSADTPAALSLSSPAPAVHKSRQVSKFEDRYGLVVPFCGEFEFESDPDGYDYRDHVREYVWEYRDPGDDGEEDEIDKYCVPDTIPNLIKYINQVRQSFGFDVDCNPPGWFKAPFGPVNLSEAKLDEDQYLHNYITRIVNFAIREINADLSGSGKSIELVQLDKFVVAGAWRKLLTLSVKEVDDAAQVVDDTKIIQAIVDVDHGPDQPLIFEQWRFKPLEGDDAWYKLGDEDEDEDYDDDVEW